MARLRTFIRIACISFVLVWAGGIASGDALAEDAPVVVAVNTASGPEQGIKVYLFNESGSYLGINGTTDTNGEASFELEVGESFKFRADILSSQYWSDVFQVSGGETNTVEVAAGGGLLQLTLEDDTQNPIEGIKTYLFNASGKYLGQSRTSDSSGEVEFSVPEGTYNHG